MTFLRNLVDIYRNGVLGAESLRTRIWRNIVILFWLFLAVAQILIVIFMVNLGLMNFWILLQSIIYTIIAFAFALWWPLVYEMRENERSRLNRPLPESR